VAIVDWDVHSRQRQPRTSAGDPSISTASTHEMPSPPARGRPPSAASTDHLNVALAGGDGSDQFREAFGRRSCRGSRASAPTSCDLGGLRRPLAGPARQPQPHGADSSGATKQLMDIADRSLRRARVSLLEGGYDLQGLSRSVAAHVETLMGAVSGGSPATPAATAELPQDPSGVPRMTLTSLKILAAGLGSPQAAACGRGSGKDESGKPRAGRLRLVLRWRLRGLRPPPAGSATPSRRCTTTRPQGGAQVPGATDDAYR
jgi:hypothetical protein